MYVDVKVTAWHRMHLNENKCITAKEIISILQKRNINYLWNMDGLNADYELVYGTEVYMHPEENDGQPTIKLYDDNERMIWDNSIIKS